MIAVCIISSLPVQLIDMPGMSCSARCSTNNKYGLIYWVDSVSFCIQNPVCIIHVQNH